MVRSRDLWKVNSKDHAVAATTSSVHAGDDLGDRATPLSGTQLSPAAGWLVDLRLRCQLVEATGSIGAMGFFRRGKGSQFDTGHPGDDELLAQLSRMSDLAAPRHWVHYLYFASESAARGAAGVVSAAGWQLQEVAESATGGPDWVVIAERHGAVTSPQAVREARVFFEAVAGRWSGEYDGWEASA